jgi:two-component system sensor histidine kinase AdeS
MKSLRFRLTFSMWAASLASVIFIFSGVVIYLLIEAVIIYEDVPESADDIAQQELFYEQNDPAYLPEADLAHGADLLAILGIALAGSAISGFVGYRFARKLSRPIEALGLAARKLTLGELNARAPTEGAYSSEITKLIHDFNAMACELERTQREQTEGASAIAHELRTPVTVLRGRLQGLADGVFELNDNTFDALVAQTETLTRIIDDLRTLSLARNGQLEIFPLDTDLSKEAGAVLAAVKPMLESAGMTVHSDVKPAPTHADPVRMRQAIAALIENARCHASKGGNLTIETGTEGADAFVRVMDRGEGLSETDASRIFDRFWRAETSRSRTSGGSGLGLAVVKSICRGHGGDVQYSDRPGGGAVFEIRVSKTS